MLPPALAHPSPALDDATPLVCADRLICSCPTSHRWQSLFSPHLVAFGAHRPAIWWLTGVGWASHGAEAARRRQVQPWASRSLSLWPVRGALVVPSRLGEQLRPGLP